MNLQIPEKKSSRDLRLITFNVNGVKTIFNYHPWNTHNRSFDALFQYLNADIISLQELKLTPQNISSTNIGNTTKYRSFVSVPKTKKGYSGVSLCVRIPSEDEDPTLAKYLRVVRAEEGLTGYLSSPDQKGLRYRDLSPEECIGCYPSDINEENGLALDSEGRCVAVQLESNLVIFSVYCPANSSGTEEGELQRLEFLRVLLQRCKRLKESGTDVIIMGDINVSLDLIDHAEYMKEAMKQGIVKPIVPSKLNGKVFEDTNQQACIDFKNSTPARALVNAHVFPSNKELTVADPSQQFLYDTTRAAQNRRLAMYTVWNTLTGARQTNYGSRIDLILTSSNTLFENVSSADIWPFLHGSDHCPAFTDFEVHETETKLYKSMPLKLEAKNFFKLVQHRDISQMFKTGARKTSESEDVSEQPKGKKTKIVYTSRKKSSETDQRPINTFFFTDTKLLNHSKVSESSEMALNDSKPTSLDLQQYSKLLYGEPPKCSHGKAAELKTSLKNPKTKGKKFWTCAYTNKFAKQPIPSNDCRCDFFQWAEPKKA